ncbi:MAG: hypothetical protein H0W24_04100 [Lysobacter sp.]|nr:hypothetical protein [Lysobacter sp.]
MGTGAGYVLTGDKPQHPSNHWGVAAFAMALRRVASEYANEHPDHPLRYNDMSLPMGGLFDIATRSQSGYDWTPPHKTHRLGTNLDMGIPQGNARRALVSRLYQMAGINVFREDEFHWHLTY